MTKNKPGFKAVNGEYDKETKTLEIKTSMYDFVPGYAYYICEDLEDRNKVEIKFIRFKKEHKLYEVAKLKGKRDWDEV